MLNFANKMLNTIMGTDDQPGQGPGQGQQHMAGMPQGQGARPMGGFPQVRPSPQLGGARPYGGPPSFTGPRPSPGLIRGGAPNFGGMARPMGPPGSGPGTPHRFNGPQPLPQSMPRGMMPGGPQLGLAPRGPGPPGQVQGMPPLSPRQRAPQPRQQFQQKIQPPLQLAGGGGSGGGTPVPDLDLSHLSAEERAMIENVMAKAQQLEHDVPPAPIPQTSAMGQPGPSRMMRPEDQRGPGPGYEGDFGGARLCPLCRQRDLSGRDGHLAQECAECGTLVCNRCGGLATHPETKRPEFTCGNCIKRRRTGAMQAGGSTGTMGPPGQQNAGVRPQMRPSPFSQQQPSTMEWESGRRGSGGSIGVGGPGRSNQQQRWENERECEGSEVEHKALDHLEYEEVDRLGDLSSETSLSPQEWTEGLRDPVRGSSSKTTPLDLPFMEPPIPSTCISPDHTLSMSTPISASASKAKPSFVKLHSRSVSLDSTEGGEPSYNNGFHVSSPPLESSQIKTPVTAASAPLQTQQPQEPSKTNALMEELSKLQSAVESYNLKRKERETKEPGEEGSQGQYVRRLSPSLSPSPRESPIESLSPIPSPTVSASRHLASPGKGGSPESPEMEFPEPRKSIVLRDTEFEDYRSSTDEESESDSDDERKGLAESEAVAFYDHSPGEVYTIPEEEDEGGSPTGADLVTSLNRPGIQGSIGEAGMPRRRMMGQECAPGMTMPPDQRHGIRPQLRPQRSLDNRLPLMPNQPQGDMSQIDRQGNVSYSNNNVNNTQLQNQMANMEMQELLAQTSIASLTGHSSMQQQQQQPQQPQQSSGMMAMTSTQLFQEQPVYSSMGGSDQQHMEPGLSGMQQRPGPAHQAQLMQKTVDNLSEWNNNMSLGDHSATGQRSGSSLDQQNMPGTSQQSYQQPQQPNTSVYGQPQPQYPLGQQDLQSQQQPPHMMPQQVPHTQLDQQHMLQQQQQQFPGQQQQYPAQQPQPLQQQQPFQPQFPPQSQLPAQQPQVQLQQSQQQQLHQQQLQAQQLQEQQLQAQQLQQMQTSASQQQQLGSLPPSGVLGGSSAYPNQPWPPQQPIFDQSGRNISSPSTSQFSQQPQAQSQYQGQLHVQPPTPLTMSQQQGQSHLNISTSQAGPNKSISGLLADFSRALGLGSTSPRPSPSDEKELFALQAAEAQHGQMLSPYEQYLQQQQQSQGAMQQMGHQPLQPAQPQVQPSAFASIQDQNQMYVQQQKQNQQMAQQQHPYQQQAQLGLQNIPPGPQPNLQQPQSYVSPQSQQQYAQQGNIPNHQQVMTQAGIMTQQQAASLGVGVVGALSPAQAHMYQQQMALQHQQQHMKKTSRRAHLTGSAGDMRRDGGQPTVFISGQGLQVSPAGMTIGGLTPAVVTSLGAFIGGGPALIGTNLLQQPMAGASPVGTPRSGRDAGDSSDTMSETDSQKSLRMRRKLPCLPPDQEAAPLPSTKKRERQRAQETFRSLSPMRMATFDNLSANRTYPMSSFGLSRPSASESNLRKISGLGISDPVPRPGSALGLLQGSSVVSNFMSKSETVYPLSGFSTTSLFPGMRLRTTNSGFATTSDMTTTTSVLSGLYPSYKSSDEWSSNLAELAACLPPDLRHLLNKGDTDLSGLSGMSNLTSGLGETTLNVGSHLPTYMRTIREQLQEERRQLLSDERRRLEALRERDRELGARLDAVTSRAGSERSRADLTRNVGISRSAGASPVISRKVKGHRRQLSDPKLSLPFSPIQEDGDHELQDFDRTSAGILRSQYKSLEYESLEDSDLLRPTTRMGEWDRSQSYLASSWAAAGGVLRETAINSMGMVSDDDDFRYRSSSRYMPRRSSEGEAWSLLASSSGSRSLTRDKRHHLRKHRKSRSWHPSPYVSEEEEEEEEENINREEKKARIKAEIARRRQQIQERAGIHQELMRMTRVRDGTEHDRHSVLKSVDQLIRDQYGGQGRFDQHSMSNSRHAMLFGRDKYGGSISSGVISPCASEEDRSIERIASTFRSDDYTNLLYDRLGEMSPFATDSESMGSEMACTPAAMPILPDMPTTYRDRSRRLLEDIGRTEGGHRSHRDREGSRGNLKGRSSEIRRGRVRATKQSRSIEQFPEDYDAPCSLSHRSANADPSHPVTSAPPRYTSEPETSPLEERKAQAPDVQKVEVQEPSEDVYPYPVKKYFLTRDPNDRSVGGNGFGLRIVGGKEIPLSGGHISAYVAKIYPGTVSESLGDIQEGDAVLEWNGESLENKTFEEVQSIVGSSVGEIEVVLRSNFNTHTGKPRFHKTNGYDSSRNSESNFNLLDEISNPMSPENITTLDETLSNKDKELDCSFFSTCPSMTSAAGLSKSGGSVKEEMTDDKTTVERERRYSDQIKSPSSISVEATSIGTCSLRHSVVAEGSVSELCGTFRTSSQQQRKSLETETDTTTTTSPPLIFNELRNSCGGGGRGQGLNGKGRFANGQIQLQICHDPKANILYVTILKAKLPKQNEDGTNHVQVDPYVVVYLLPERILENKRRTRHVPMSSTPFWNQTMVYPNVSVSDLANKLLEVSAWNHNSIGDDTLFGKVTLQLSESGILDEQPHLYYLKTEENGDKYKSVRQRLSKFGNTIGGKSISGKHSSQSASSKCSWEESSSRRGVSIFPRGNMQAQNVLPTDCRGGGFCALL